MTKRLYKNPDNAAPFSIFQDLLVNVISETRDPTRPWFLDTSRTKIGRHTFCNRITNISKRMRFEWYGKKLSADVIRTHLKTTFYPYLA